MLYWKCCHMWQPWWLYQWRIQRSCSGDSPYSLSEIEVETKWLLWLFNILVLKMLPLQPWWLITIELTESISMVSVTTLLSQIKVEIDRFKCHTFFLSFDRVLYRKCLTWIPCKLVIPSRNSVTFILWKKLIFWY